MLGTRIFLLVALGVSACGEVEVEPPPVEEPLDVFIALTASFADYESWVKLDRGRDPVPPSHRGRSLIYIDRVPPRGSDEFPVGTRIVKVELLGADPRGWELHAMVKRGDSFNSEGAPGWEFFELTLDGEDTPSIVWRGEGPADGDGYVGPEGGDVLSCNHCHASATYNDSILSPVLALSEVR